MTFSVAGFAPSVHHINIIYEKLQSSFMYYVDQHKVINPVVNSSFFACFCCFYQIWKVSLLRTTDKNAHKIATKCCHCTLSTEATRATGFLYIIHGQYIISVSKVVHIWKHLCKLSAAASALCRLFQTFLVKVFIFC